MGSFARGVRVFPRVPLRGVVNLRPDMTPPLFEAHDTAGAAGAAHKLSQMLLTLARDERRDRISVADILSALNERALGALLFIFALPNVLPMPPGASGLLGVPLIFLALQLTFGRAAWLPKAIAQRSLTRGEFAALVSKVAPALERAERLLRPRLVLLATPPAKRLIGLACLLLAVILSLPIPLGNMLPAAAICLLALGLLERDGLWVLVGLATAAASTLVVSGVIYAAFKAVLYFVTRIW